MTGILAVAGGLIAAGAATVLYFGSYWWQLRNAEQPPAAYCIRCGIPHTGKCLRDE